ncbi:glycine cleavage system transcriptional repressor [Enemella evansiae]|uniref:glycine cleavage system protein R n=1 Tax=Enemella evansiae TaxID=2016499 RepID=UPI000B97B011|nr:ACT domain-containing protein [Enemella evansiae]PFG68847.1 glycine cleavage system regulatory protein [Propionibacteriaceae bacterium ES.041]OYN97033.1 amino acid-binding ACT protein [Enemella evansiae]OYO00532.1 amino acid-binding ACT protein [Enemella evansiae]OYO06125.1 amino acid-binding ACT protein [Enemella evansiae]OYO13859.1 amino acid-binding ACT protein [Enemella evansiae]
MASVVLTLVGDDRPGLVSALAQAVTDCGGSWHTSEMARLGGKFAGIVLVEISDEKVDPLTQELRSLGHQGLLEVTMSRTDGEAEESTALLELHLLGNDRPGIVHQISSVLAAQGVSIEQLETDVRDAPEFGGQLFEARARLVGPAEVDRRLLAEALESIANELMVDLDLS